MEILFLTIGILNLIILVVVLIMLYGIKSQEKSGESGAVK